MGFVLPCVLVDFFYRLQANEVNNEIDQLITAVSSNWKQTLRFPILVARVERKRLQDIHTYVLLVLIIANLLIQTLEKIYCYCARYFSIRKSIKYFDNLIATASDTFSKSLHILNADSIHLKYYQLPSRESPLLLRLSL